MALSNEQLLMLDTLIYVNKKYLSDGKSVREILLAMENDDFKCDGASMSSAEWRDFAEKIRNDSGLLEYRIQNFFQDPNSGFRAAAFVDDVDLPSDVNVIFRGTSSDAEWHDNGEGAYKVETYVQRLAALYVRKLPDKFGKELTVSGHSKGGNEAQYVTIVTDRVKRCISYDGQGFSKKFLEEYAPEIKLRAHKITSISNSWDFVNCLLHPIAVERIYLDCEREKIFKMNHKPNIMLDDTGHLYPETKERDFSKLINEFTTYLVDELPDFEAEYIADGVIAILEGWRGEEGKLHTVVAGINLSSHIDDFVLNTICEKLGVDEETGLKYAAFMFPTIFGDELIEYRVGQMVELAGKMGVYVESIYKRMVKAGEKLKALGERFIDAANNVIEEVKGWYAEKSGAGSYIASNTKIQLDSVQMRNYATRLAEINRRIQSIDRRMDSLYWRVGLLDLWNLMQADILTSYSFKLTRCQKYLQDTATDFENLERILMKQL